jgi:DNA polymerase-3 subunit alpha
MLDGACDVEKLCQRVEELGMPAVAMTDHGNIFGAVHFVNAAKDAGVKPILGCELYICKKDDHRIERTPPEGDSYNHLLVLAENEEGYRNLAKITSEASLHGFYYKPRMSKKFLAEHSRRAHRPLRLFERGSGRTPGRREVRGGEKGSLRLRRHLRPGNFYLEIQDQGLERSSTAFTRPVPLEQELGSTAGGDQ